MNEQKSTATKNIQMLQEMASSNKDDLSMFFSNALKLTADSIESTKTYRENIPLKDDFPELEKLFRNLHTIKGNSRIFGLSLISSFVHKLESDVNDFRELKNSKQFVNIELEWANKGVKARVKRNEKRLKVH